MDEKSTQCNGEFPKSPYRPLNTTQREIRLLEIEDTTGPISCRLKHVSLNAYSTEFARVLQLNQLESARCEKAMSYWVNHCAGRYIDGSDSYSVIKLPRWRLSHGGMEWERLRKSLNLEPELENPLDSLQKGSIRIVESVKARSKEFSSEEMFHVSPRFTWGDFEAISYRWESETNECDIFLNGAKIKIPRNLEAALKKVRYLSEVRTGMFIWCDALCIDQENLTEKSHQVGIMKEIYQSAFAVLVWLGVEDIESNMAVNALIQHDYLHRKITPTSPPENFGVSSEDYRLWLTKLPWEYLLEFCRRDYWHRVWIVQELALNHHMTLFLSGSREMCRTMILSIADTGKELAVGVARKLENNKGRVSSTSQYSQQEIYGAFAHVWELLTMRNEIPLGKPFDLSKVLDLAQKAKCKDARDKIYGLLGLMPQEAAGMLIPDYEISIKNLYIEFAKFMLSTEGLTSLLSWRCSLKATDLPTWVPDWRTKFSRNHVQWLMKRHASSKHKFLPEIDLKKQTLECRGILLDSLCSFSKSMNESFPYRTVKKSSQKFGVHDENGEISQNPYGDRAALSIALQRTILMDHPNKSQINILHSPNMLQFPTAWLSNIPWIDWDVLETLQYDTSMADLLWKDMALITHNPLWDTFDRFRQTNADFSVAGLSIRDIFCSMFHHQSSSFGYATNSAKHTKERSNFSDQRLKLTDLDEHNMMIAVLALEGRKLGTTGKGYVGLVPQEAQDGDIVAVIYGCSFPVILRHATGMRTPSCQINCNFEYVGECYVDGIMDGEVLETANIDESEVSIFLV